MKDFLKYMSATVVGIFVFFIITGALMVMSIIGMVASESSATDVSDNTVFVLSLNGMMQERSERSLFDEVSSMNNDATSTIGLDEVLEAIDKAKHNDKIKGIYIEAGMFAPDSYASAQAMRNALADFKKSGKWIVAYADTYTQGTYYIASVANKVYLNPYGQLDWHGLAAQPLFVKDVMAKFGVKMQVAKVGAYKSATEMFTEEKMSDANREQITAYINGLWQNICKEVGASRNISVDKLNAYADRFITLSAAKDYVASGLVDQLLYTDQVKAEVNKLLKAEADEDINTVYLADMANVKAPKKEGEEIAVYYAYGDIVDVASGSMSSSSHQIVGKDVCADLKQLMDDDDVKAVVIRVNSGGGSAYASEQMWHAVEMLKKKKPVVVSMGGLAASGGYYMSCGAQWIVAEPTTLTGSIGIFGMFPDFSGLLTEKLGVKFDEVKTNKFAGFGSMSRPFNEEEMSYLSSYISRGYELFRQRVATGRKMKVEDVEQVAQGRVWLGQDAVKLKLVDELGGLDKAVAKAASLAKVKDYYTSAYPGKTDWTEFLFNTLSGRSYIDSKLQAVLGDSYGCFMMMKDISHRNAIQARIPFDLNIK